MTTNFFCLKVGFEIATLHIRENNKLVAQYLPPTGYLFEPTTVYFPSGTTDPVVLALLNKQLLLCVKENEYGY